MSRCELHWPFVLSLADALLLTFGLASAGTLGYLHPRAVTASHLVCHVTCVPLSKRYTPANIRLRAHAVQYTSTTRDATSTSLVVMEAVAQDSLQPPVGDEDSMQSVGAEGSARSPLGVEGSELGGEDSEVSETQPPARYKKTRRGGRKLKQRRGHLQLRYDLPVVPDIEDLHLSRIPDPSGCGCGTILACTECAIRTDCARRGAVELALAQHQVGAVACFFTAAGPDSWQNGVSNCEQRSRQTLRLIYPPSQLHTAGARVDPGQPESGGGPVMASRRELLQQLRQRRDVASAKDDTAHTMLQGARAELQVAHARRADRMTPSSH